MTHLSSIGKYEIIDVLGEGAMGVVYRALDPVLGREVAIKVMNDALARDDDFRTRFMREARAAGSLQHPNVITVFDCGEVEGHLFIAMELVKGADLEHLMGAGTSLTMADKLEIMIGVLNALSYAHKRGIVHRDIKPANIRVNEEGRALIMDFGIAHIQSSNMTKTGMMVGTPNYMAPEQVMGGKITPQTDIFAAGAVLYELLTNVRPFEGENMHSVLYKIVSEPPPRPEKVVTGLRPDITEVVMKALAKEPADRYATTADMAAALTKGLSTMSNAPTVARTLSLRASIETALNQEHAEQAAEQAARAKKKRNMRIAMAAAGAVIVLGGGGAMVMRGRAATPPAPAQTVTSQPAPSASPAVTPPTEVAATSQSAPVPTAPAPTTPDKTPAHTASRVKPEAAQLDPALLKSLEATAMQMRKRATDAGATVDQLQGGDGLKKSADKLAASGKRSEAMQALNSAITSWGEAENGARATAIAAANAATQQTARENAARQQVAQAPPLPVTAPIVSAAPPTAPVGNPSRDIAALVADYAHAIESRDIGKLRRLYPEMSSTQANAFDDFFKSVRSIKATLGMSNLQVEGASAEGTLTGAYDFVTAKGRDQHQPLSLQATVKRDGNGWHFVSIR